MKISSIEKIALKQAYDSDLEAVEDTIIDAFLKRKVEVDQSESLATLIRFFERNGFFKDIYTLAFGFQYLVTDADRYRNNGVVFTPREIAHRIISSWPRGASRVHDCCAPHVWPSWPVF